MIAGIVLAAGGATRFGAPKQLAQVGGGALIERAVRVAGEAGLDPIVVVLGAYADRIAAQAELGGATVVVCDDWEAGQAYSLRCGIAAAHDADAAVILLADQPFVEPESIKRLVAARGRAPALRATYGGVSSHPVLIESALFEAVSRLEGDTGARDLLRDAGVALLPCDDLGSGLDVDTPDDLEQARSAFKQR